MLLPVYAKAIMSGEESVRTTGLQLGFDGFLTDKRHNQERRSHCKTLQDFRWRPNVIRIQQDKILAFKG